MSILPSNRVPLWVACSFLHLLLPLSVHAANVDSVPTESDPAAVAVDESKLALHNFQSDLENFIDTSLAPHTPGLALAVVIDGKLVVSKGFGVKKVGGEEAVDENTVFRLASLSKSFASAAVGVLVQQGKVDWDTRIQPLLPEVKFKDPEYGGKLTLRHLLSHTSGLVPHAYTNLIEGRNSYENILRHLKKVDFLCPPGRCYGYQNVVYSLSGDVIEAITASPFTDFARDNLFVPLDMHSASYGLEALKKTPNRATPHVWARKRWHAVEVKNNYYKVAPAAGVNASISDLSQWLMAQLGHYPEVLTPKTLDTLHAKQIKTRRNQAHYGQWEDFRGVHYGLGWRLFDYGEHANFVHHGGWVQGMRSEMVFNRQLDMGLVMLCNSETNAAGDIVPTFLHLYAHHFLTEAP